MINRYMGVAPSTFQVVYIICLLHLQYQYSILLHINKPFFHSLQLALESTAPQKRAPLTFWQVRVEDGPVDARGEWVSGNILIYSAMDLSF